MPKRLGTWLKDGYSVFIDLNLQYQPRESRLSEAEVVFAKIAVDKWIEMGAIRVLDINVTHKRAVVGNCVVAYRDGVMDRICWSGVPVNEGVDDKAFKMESVKDICAQCMLRDWEFSFDLAKGFQQIPLKRSFAEYCLFRLDGVVYQWLVVPQGL